MTDERNLEPDRAAWDAEAGTFDEAADHGLRDATVRQAWADVLCALLPPVAADALDIGCGTGSLSLLLAEQGWRVTGVDFSPAMIKQAEAKAAAAGHRITFSVMDAAFPDLPPQSYDAIICRHLLWMLPEPTQVLERWLRLLRPGGRLILIEGFWHTGVGLPMQTLLALLPDGLTDVSTHSLSTNTALWGGEVSDERYAVTADLPR
jgi:ubiquinone/menaquinone biosynthesis C-methylase UbiE